MLKISYRLVIHSNDEIFIYKDSYDDYEPIATQYSECVYFDNNTREYIGKRINDALHYYLKFKETLPNG